MSDVRSARGHAPAWAAHVGQGGGEVAGGEAVPIRSTRAEFLGRCGPGARDERPYPAEGTMVPKPMSYFMVDVEADGPIPGATRWWRFGAVVVEPGLQRTFYGRLRPISERWIPDRPGGQRIFPRRDAGVPGRR